MVSLSSRETLLGRTARKQANSSRALQTSLRTESQELVPDFQQSSWEKSTTGILAAVWVLEAMFFFSPAS
ncbi:unnamed protein product [Malus baccata var. baccata]